MGHFWRGESRMGSKDGPRESREGVHKQIQDEVREKDDVREDDHQKCLDVKTQIWNSEPDQTKTTPRTPRASSPNVSRGWNYNLKSASATNDHELLARVDRKCDQRKIMKSHHPIIPDRQGPTDELSPNRHEHRSCSHNDKSDDDLKVRILNQPLDT